MQISENSKFNMWDTNGRRSDVINAMSIYLSILQELETEFPGDEWASYPNSLKEYEFYKRAIAASPDVFEEHKSYDKFEEDITPYRTAFLKRDVDFLKDVFPKFKDTLDKNIEARARHYTSNLVKLGFITIDRRITPAGIEFLSGMTKRDSIEELLPVSDLNIILLRQIMKLRIFTKFNKNTAEGNYYSPFFMASYLLLKSDAIDRKTFKELVLNSTPYSSRDLVNVAAYSINKPGSEMQFDVPYVFTACEKVNMDDFCKYITTSKSSNEYQKLYYDFYSAIYSFLSEKNADNFDKLVNVIRNDSKFSIKAAFLKNSELNIGRKGHYLSLNEFLKKNRDSDWLNDSKNINTLFYIQYVLSKSIELTAEYSDTLLRLLSATGIFNFSGSLPELLYDDFFRVIFDKINHADYVFGKVTADEYEEYEKADASFFGRHTTITEILGFSKSDIYDIILKVSQIYGGTDIQQALKNIKRERMTEHVVEKYPKEKILELLSYVSGRKHDDKIQGYVNSGADVPTIYEYIITIAWYYISGQNFSILDSFNLELNGEFEPLRHASGGQGDIEVFYDDGRIVMLEVTLMNKQAQKRGEWEPVLRHSINLKSQYEDRETTTLFIADELDTNSINIWRAVACVPLESSLTGKLTDKVFIMPFTNAEIIQFLSDGVSGTDIVHSVRESFEKIDYTFDENWRSKILSEICN